MPVRRIGYGGGARIDDTAVSADTVWSSQKTNAEVQARAPAGHTHDWAEVQNKPSTFPPAAHTHSEYLRGDTNEVAIGAGAAATASSEGVAIGKGAQAQGFTGLALGTSDTYVNGSNAAKAQANSIALRGMAEAQRSVAIGGRTTQQHTIYIGTQFDTLSTYAQVKIGQLIWKQNPSYTQALGYVGVANPGDLHIYYDPGTSELRFRLQVDWVTVKEGKITLT